MNRYPYKGQHLTVRELSELPECVVDMAALTHRLSQSWPVTRALTQPKAKPGSRSGRTPWNKYRGSV